MCVLLRGFWWPFGWDQPVLLARIIHDGSLRNRAVAKRDRRAEPRGRKADSKQYVDRPSGEPACLDAAQPRSGLLQRRIRVMAAKPFMSNEGQREQVSGVL